MTLLISKSDFSEYVDVSSNVAEKYFDRHILTAQNRYLRPILGDAFYDEILQDKETGYYGTGIETLIDTYIKPYLVWRSYQVYLPYSTVFLTGQGPKVFKEDFSDTPSDRRISIMTDEAKSNAQFYERILYDYLRDNKETFTTWDDATDKDRPGYLPRISGVGRETRQERLNDGKSFTYNKEAD
jgi:hypothetical protein